jgi:hypothetical protein
MEAKPIGVTDAVPEDHGGDEVAFALRQARQAKTLLGRQLWEIRARIIASGVPLFPGTKTIKKWPSAEVELTRTTEVVAVAVLDDELPHPIRKRLRLPGNLCAAGPEFLAQRIDAARREVGIGRALTYGNDKPPHFLEPDRRLVTPEPSCRKARALVDS